MINTKGIKMTLFNNRYSIILLMLWFIGTGKAISQTPLEYQNDIGGLSLPRYPLFIRPGQANYDFGYGTVPLNEKIYIKPDVTSMKYNGAGSFNVGEKGDACGNKGKFTLHQDYIGNIRLNKYYNIVEAGPSNYVDDGIEIDDVGMECIVDFNPGVYGNFSTSNHWIKRINPLFDGQGCKDDGGWRELPPTKQFCKLKAEGLFGNGFITNGYLDYSSGSPTTINGELIIPNQEYTIKMDETNTVNIGFKWASTAGYCTEIFQGGAAKISVVLVSKNGSGINTNYGWTNPIPINTGADGAIGGFNKTYTETGLYEFKILLHDRFDNGYYTSTFLVRVMPNCYNDPSPNLSLSQYSSNSGSIETVYGGYANAPIGGYKLERNKDYVINFGDNIANFCTNYKVVADDGSILEGDITIPTETACNYNVKNDLGNTHIQITWLGIGNQYKIRLLDPVGSYRIYAVKKADIGSYCNSYNPINLFVGGQNLTAFSPCLVELPEDMQDIFPDFQQVNSPFGLQYIFTHFTHSITSSQGITIRSVDYNGLDEIILRDGAFLNLGITYDQPQEEVVDNDKNWSQSWAYDEEGNLMAESKSFFDSKGNPTQQQAKVLSRRVVMASEVAYDKYGRPAIQTLAAPVSGRTTNQSVLECGDDIRAGGDVNFIYKSNFATSGGKSLSQKLLESENTSIDDVGAPGTLGWFYSNQNVKSAAYSETENSFVESYTGLSQHPYVRTIYHTDGSGEVKGVTAPNNQRQLSTGKFATSETLKLDASDATLINHYLTIRNTYIFPGVAENPTTLMESIFKSKTTDAEGKVGINYVYKSGKLLITFNMQTADHAYSFYDIVGRMICSISPNGLKQLSSGVPFADIDKTTYKYSYRGLLLESNEKDVGITRFMYNKSGQLRFSQKANQVTSGQFNYIVYDAQLRPVENGVFQPIYGTSIAFGNDVLKAQLEQSSSNYDLHTGGIKTEVVKLFFDEADQAALAAGKIYEPQNIIGKLSYTIKQDGTDFLTTWFSYDEQGRLVWMIQELPVLGIKKIAYKYAPNGKIKELAYQRGASDAFYHIYDYDRDGRLIKVYTSRTEPVYDGNSLISVADLQTEYFYNLNGQVKRVELGKSAQGIDYTYTMEGWLKSINNPDINSDPGKDGITNIAFARDVFSMSLDYYYGDYYKPATGVGFHFYMTEQQPELIWGYYDGKISNNTWYTQKDGSQNQDAQQGYHYSYDNRNQLQKAQFGYAQAATYPVMYTGDKFYEGDLTYDPNGNILNLKRKNETGAIRNDFSYTYENNSNKLTSVAGYGSYTYGPSGEITSISKAGNTQYIKSKPGGKIEAVAANQDYSNPFVTFSYNSTGQRYKKETYNPITHELVYITYYTHDLAGNIMSVYIYDPADQSMKLVETPIYGSDKVGSVHRNGTVETTVFELRDHLGSVRATVSPVKGVPTPINLSSGYEGTDYNNFYSGTYSNLLSTAQVRAGSKSILLQSQSSETNRGPISRYPVTHHDVINASVYSYSSSTTAGSLNARLIDGEGNYLYTQSGTEYTAEWSNGRNGNDWQAITLSFTVPEVLFDKEGQRVNASNIFVEIYPRTEEVASDVYFDDLNINIQYTVSRNLPEVVINTTTDYYPWGEEMPNKNYKNSLLSRNSFQGKYAEKDEETGWNAFELRMYDPTIGRWMGPDPYKQYYSAYVGMGNDPVNGIDPDGGRKIYYNADGDHIKTTHDNWFHNTFAGNQNFMEDRNGNIQEITKSQLNGWLDEGIRLDNEYNKDKKSVYYYPLDEHIASNSISNSKMSWFTSIQGASCKKTMFEGDYNYNSNYMGEQGFYKHGWLYLIGGPTLIVGAVYGGTSVAGQYALARTALFIQSKSYELMLSSSILMQGVNSDPTYGKIVNGVMGFYDHYAPSGVKNVFSTDIHYGPMPTQNATFGNK